MNESALNNFFLRETGRLHLLLIEVTLEPLCSQNKHDLFHSCLLQGDLNVLNPSLSRVEVAL